MERILCCEKDAVKRGQWTLEEDAKLVSYISQHGTRNWRLIPKKAGLQRCGKSCRLRWTNYLRPDLKQSIVKFQIANWRIGEFTSDEEQSIVKLHSVVGNRWSLIAAQLPGRTDNDVKNHWNTKLKKKLSGMGIDPVTHKPFSHLMAEIASTLAPPQVAHLAEAALGCFKDEMLHLLTKKRIDWQLEKTACNATQPANRIWDLPPRNSFCHENRAKDKRSVDAENSKAVESNIFTNQPAISPSKPWDSEQINADVKALSTCSGLNGMYSSFLQPPGPTYRYSSTLFAGGGITSKYEVTPSPWTVQDPGQAENLDRTSILTSSPALKDSHEKQQQGVEGGGSSMALWKLQVECNDDEEGSPWSQSACSGSTCTAGHRHGFPPPQIKEEEDEEEEEEEAASDGGGASVKGVEAFNSDCVLWDLSDDLMNLIL